MIRRVLFLALTVLTMQRMGVYLYQAATPSGLLTLNTTDLPFQGYLRMPTSGTDTTTSFNGLGGYVTGGHTHLLLYGPYASGPPPIYEVDVNGLTPNLTLGSAPRTVLASNHGSFVNGTDVSGGKRNSWQSPGSVSKVRTDSGTTTLIASAGSDRAITVAVTVSTTFANGDGTQPTLALGQTGNTTKFAATSEFTNQTGGTTLTYSGTLTSGTALIATLVAATGTTSTGAYTIYYGLAQADTSGGNLINNSIYVHPSNGLWYFTFHVNYTDIAFWSMYAYEPATGTSCGPWRFTYSNTAWGLDGTRTHWVIPHPTTGKLLGGGSSKSGNISIPWGPSLIGGVDWPTCATPGGLAGGMASPISMPDDYVNFYYPSGTYNNLGALTGTIKQFLFPTTLSYAFENYGSTSVQIDPAQNSSRGTYGDEINTLTPVLWFEGTNKKGVLFTGVTGTSTDGNSHNWYLNAQTGNLHVTPTGTCTDGATLTGGTSGATAILTSKAGTSYWYFNTNTVNFTVGETVTCSVGGGSGVVLSFYRADLCNHGNACVQCASAGPSSTKTTTTFAILNPADLNAVQAGSKTDYTVEATSIVDAQATWGFQTSGQSTPTANLVFGSFYESSSRTLYLVAPSADCTRTGNCNFPEAAILVFGPINDSPAPRPLPTLPLSIPLASAGLALTLLWPRRMGVS